MSVVTVLPVIKPMSSPTMNLQQLFPSTALIQKPDTVFINSLAVIVSASIFPLHISFLPTARSVPE